MDDDYKKLLVKSLEGKKLILASNRGPYAYSFDKNMDLKKNRGKGGLVSAFLSLLYGVDFTWFSVASSDADSHVNAGEQRFITVDKQVYNAYYNKMCNEIFWFVQHGLWDAAYNPIFDDQTMQAWDSYVQVNKMFAKELTNELKKTAQPAVVMLQDYHLYLAAKYIPPLDNVKKVHFTHIPWPSPDTISVLPSRILKDVLEGLLANDLLGFHCQEYVDNFLETCKRFLDVPVKTPVFAFPISIDSQALFDEANLPSVEKFEKDINKDQRFIFRADRVEPSKNIVRGFLAFERMLELFPELIGKIVFVAYLYESRSDLDYYRTYLEKVKLTVDTINKRFGNSLYTPIQLRLADNYFQTLAAYKQFDVLLVNSIADGMNLVAKEGPLLNTNDGVVVLSDRTGAHNELNEFCLSINPFDVDETAKILKRALSMKKEERSARNFILKDVITKNNSSKWLYHQLKHFK